MTYHIKNPSGIDEQNMLLRKFYHDEDDDDMDDIFEETSNISS